MTSPYPVIQDLSVSDSSQYGRLWLYSPSPAPAETRICNIVIANSELQTSQAALDSGVDVFSLLGLGRRRFEGSGGAVVLVAVMWHAESAGR
jgi:hypothetical protein